MAPDSGVAHADVFVHGPDGVQNVAQTTLPVTNAVHMGYGGGSADLSHVVFKTDDPLLASDTIPAQHDRVYEATGGTLRLVSILPDGTQPLDSDVGRGYGGSAAPGYFHAVSEDGSRIFFQTPFGGNVTAGGVLYMRVNGTTTVEISTPRGTSVTPGTERVFFQAATPDGAHVFFVSYNQLTPSAPASPGPGATVQLYRYDVDSDTLTYETTLKRVSLNRQVVAALSDDGSRLYLATNSQLVPSTGAPTNANLYLWEGGQAHYVGTANPFVDGYANFLQSNGPAPLNVTPDGGKLAFLSSKQLTAYNNGGKTEVYVYDVVSDAVSCASCPPDGAPATGSAGLAAFHWAQVQTTASSITADGTRVFFQTPQALVPEDVNGKSDVYEYVDGAPHLISSGTGSTDSFFLEVTRSGRDAFFLTRDSLVQDDVDGGFMDVYDARVGGGFPPRPVPAAPCNADACRPATSKQPDAITPASTTFFSPVDQLPDQIPSVSVGRISPAARARLAQTGKLTLTVRSGVSGVLSATAQARIGSRMVLVATATRPLASPGTAHLTLRLSTTARRQLSSRGTLFLRVQVKLSDRGGEQTVTLKLRSAGQASHRAGNTDTAKARTKSRGKEAR